MCFARSLTGVRTLLVVAALLAMGASGCGGTDEPEGGAGDSEAIASNSANGPSEKEAAGGDASASPDQRAIGDLMRHLREVYNRPDGREFCSNLTQHGEREVVNLAKQVDLKASDCEGIVEEFANGVIKAGNPQLPVEILRITVKGPHARVVMKGGLSGVRSVIPFRVVKAGAKWKLDDPLSARDRLIRVDGVDPEPK